VFLEKQKEYKMENLSNASGYLIMKFIGVSPEGLTKLHDAVTEANEGPVLEHAAEKSKVTILSSKLSDKVGEDYVIELKVPYQSGHQDKDHSQLPVPFSVISLLLTAVGQFQPPEDD
jgi:tetrahydromethanopterin S-methyltransferase subunit H